MTVREMFEKKGYIAAICHALRLGWSLTQAEDYVGKLRLNLIESTKLVAQ